MLLTVLLLLAIGPHTAMPQPRRVTATFRDAKLKDVFAEIEKQTGYRLLIEDNHANHDAIKRTFSGTFGDATFWEVFDAICRQCGAQRVPWSSRRTVHLWPAPANRVASCTSGIFRITAADVVFSRTYHLGEEGGPYRQLRVEFDVAIEPGHPLLVGVEKVTEAKDSRGRSLVMDDSHRWRSGEWKAANSVTLWLEPPKKKAKRIAVLKGTIRVKVRCGTGFREVEVPYEFRDLPLP